jgi:hypothetical protein
MIPNDFKMELQQLINKHSLEGMCDMPDFIMAAAVCDFLDTLSAAVVRRDAWFDITPFNTTTELSQENVDV